MDYWKGEEGFKKAIYSKCRKNEYFAALAYRAEEAIEEAQIGKKRLVNSGEETERI